MPPTPTLNPVIFLCLVLCLFFSASPLHAEPRENDGIEQEQKAPTYVDKTHAGISERLHSASQWFDNFFNDPRIDAEPAGTRLRLRGSTTMEEGDGLSFSGKVKANVELPNLERRSQLIISNEDDDLRQDSDPESPSSDRLSLDEPSTAVGLQYTKRARKNFIYSNRLSVRLDDGLNPRLRTRGRYTLDVTESSLINLTQSFFWERVDGFGQENRIDYDYLLTKRNLLRTTFRGVFSETSNGYEWVASQQLLSSFSHKKALSTGAFVVGETRPDNFVTDYVIYTDYRPSFIKKWLFFELRPEVNWQREKDFKATLAFTFTLEVRFGYP